MNALEVLKAARKRITVKKRWTSGAYARDRQLHATTVSNPNATCWCSIGAILAEGGNDALYQAAKEMMPRHWKYPSRALARFNDSHKHEEVLALFDKAIARLERST